MQTAECMCIDEFKCFWQFYSISNKPSTAYKEIKVHQIKVHLQGESLTCGDQSDVRSKRGKSVVRLLGCLALLTADDAIIIQEKDPIARNQAEGERLHSVSEMQNTQHKCTVF